MANYITQEIQVGNSTHYKTWYMTSLLIVL